MRVSARRGLVAVAIFAGIAAPTGILTSSALAGAQPTRGHEAITATVYEVGIPASNPTLSVGGGPFTAGGVVVGKGNIADLRNGDVLLAFGSAGTIELNTTGGRFVPASVNPVSCKFIANLINAKSSIKTGTGIFSAATGTFKLNLSITGTLPRSATGGCNESMTSVPVNDTVKASAVGNISLHNA